MQFILHLYIIPGANINLCKSTSLSWTLLYIFFKIYIYKKETVNLWIHDEAYSHTLQWLWKNKKMHWCFFSPNKFIITQVMPLEVVLTNFMGMRNLIIAWSPVTFNFFPHSDCIRYVSFIKISYQIAEISCVPYLERFLLFPSPH